MLLINLNYFKTNCYYIIEQSFESSYKEYCLASGNLQWVRNAQYHEELNANFYRNNETNVSGSEGESDEDRILRMHPLVDSSAQDNYTNDSAIQDEVRHHEFQDLLGDYIEGPELFNQFANEIAVSKEMEAASVFSAGHAGEVTVAGASIPTFQDMKNYKDRLLDPRQCKPDDYQGTKNFIKYNQSSEVKVRLFIF